MDANERYLFDLQGYLVVDDALTAEQLVELNRVLDERIAAECEPEMLTHRFGHLLDWGPAFRALIDNPAITTYLEEVVDPTFRFDHAYLDVIRAGVGPIGASLHSGGTPFNPSMYYHYQDGRMHSGLTVVAYNLADVGPADGGFACVPGSHKSNYPFPREWEDMDASIQPCVERVTGPAGTAVVFTEALTHGTSPWTGTSERRTLFFKYNPYPLSWADDYADHQAYDALTERQRDILEGPNARDPARRR